MTAVTTMPVHFDDLDALGVLHNARFGILFERAMIAWWAERGVSFSGGRLDPATMRPAPWSDEGRALASALLRS